MYKEEQLLIITKTYPLPSLIYREHTCVAAINDKGELRRLYPIPFRLLSKEKQFKKWQWISAMVEKANSDKRPESYRIDTDSIKLLSSKGIVWQERFSRIEPHLCNGFGELEVKRINSGQSLGFIKPLNYELIIEREKEKEWTKAEIENLTREGLFDSDTVKNRSPLRKLPFKFYYHYELSENGITKEYKHLITDWEVGMLFWNCYGNNNRDWETKFRNKLEIEFIGKRDLHFLMGTVHRFPDQWLIVGLFYPPKTIAMQEELFEPKTGV